MPLDDGYSPAPGQLIVVKHLEHVLIPKVFAFGGFILINFLAGQGEVPLIAKVKVVLDDILTELLEYLLIFSLVDHPVEILMFEGDEVYLLYTVNLV